MKGKNFNGLYGFLPNTTFDYLFQSSIDSVSSVRRCSYRIYLTIFIRGYVISSNGVINALSYANQKK